MTLWNLTLLSFAAKHPDIYKNKHYYNPMYNEGKGILYKKFPLKNQLLAVFNGSRFQETEFRAGFGYPTELGEN